MATVTTTKSDGFEWRILLGPTHNWPLPAPDLAPGPKPINALECCELCGQPVGDGRPYTTNSAGEGAIHTACSAAESGGLKSLVKRTSWLQRLARS